MKQASDKLESYILEIKHWMLVNKLKLNGNKTESIQTSYNTKLVTTAGMCLKVGVDSMQTRLSAKNLGVIFANNMSLGPRVQALCKSANYQ